MYQKITLVGRLGRDPEMRYTPGGVAVSSFNMAVDTFKKDPASGQNEKKTAWFRVTVWNKQAETVSQYLKKGRLVLVEGRLEFDAATGGPKIWSRQDGTSGASFEVTANEVKFLERGDSDSASAGVPAQGSFADDDGDMPF